MMQDFKLSSRKLFVIVIILSFISGGLAGDLLVLLVALQGKLLIRI